MKLPNPKVLATIGELLDQAKQSKTMNNLFNRLDGANASVAYEVLNSLSEKELRVLAVLVSEANEKFNRKSKTA